MDWDIDFEEPVKTIEVKIKNPFKTDYEVYFKEQVEPDKCQWLLGSLPSHSDANLISFVTLTVLDESCRKDRKEYELYCLRSAKKFFVEWLSPRFSEWLVRLSQANLHRRVLSRTVTEMLSKIIICINDFLASIDGNSVRQRIYAKMFDWLFPTNSRTLFSTVLVRVFTFSACCHRQLDKGENSEYPIANAKLFQQETFKVMDLLVAFDREASQNDFVNFMQLPLITSLRSLGKQLVETLTVNTCAHNTYALLTKELEVLESWARSIPFAVSDQTFDNFQNVVEKDLIDRLSQPDKIMDITIMDYPHSEHAVETLRFCMGRQNGYGRERLITNLKDAVTHRMLHIGVATSIILSSYASAVESLKLLDPSCFIMHRVCSIIKAYLKKRSDTVRQIITYITTDRNPTMADQMMKRKATVVDEEDTSGVNDEFLVPMEEGPPTHWSRWLPDPPDALPGESSRFQRTADVFTMLVSVYGSKESFVKEYRQLLGERLIQTANKDSSFEQRYLDLLKLRFSDGELQQCEVMLKDVNDSKRIDKDLIEKVGLPMSTRIISSHFWPKVDNENVEEYPLVLEQGLEKYLKEYKTIKMSRHLIWIRSAGCVELTLNIDGVEVEKVVSHANAALIYLFLEQETWTPSDLAEKLKIGRGATLRRLEWWQSQGVLVQGPSDQWTLTSHASNLERFKASQDIEDDNDSDVGDATDSSDMVEELEQYWNYTKNFIANHEQREVKADRLHSIYKMFSTGAPPTIDHVTAFLQRKVRENLLSFNNGFYRVVKEPPLPST